MPAAAVARKPHPGSVTEEQARAPQRRSAPGARHAGARAHAARHRSSAVAAPLHQSAPQYQPEPVTDEPLPVVLPEYQTEIAPEELREHARAVRRRARRAHRPLQCSWSTGLGIGVVLSQLVALLWLQGLALSARNRSYALDKDIAMVQEGLSRTQKEIAALDSSPQIAGWAKARGWSLATQNQLDPVTPANASWQQPAASHAPQATTDAAAPPAHTGSAHAPRVHVNVDVVGEDVNELSSESRHSKVRGEPQEGSVP